MNDLMTLDEIAQMNHCTIRHARDVIVKLAGFPAEAPTSTPRNRLWVTKEIRTFINREKVVRSPEGAGYQEQEPGFHLYRHFDKEGKLLYVGVSISAINRLGAHRQNAHWFWNIAKVEVTNYPTREASLEAERKAIQDERPLFNIQHKGSAAA